MRGRLIGVNTAIYSRTGGFQGIGFAIPSDLVRQVMNSLVQYGKVTRGFLGITIQELTPTLAPEFKMDGRKGIIVSDVTPGSPAEKAGFQARDVITRFNGVAVEDPDKFRFAVAGTPPGSEVEIEVVRDGKDKELEITVGEMPGENPLAANQRGEIDTEILHGVRVTDLVPQTRTEFEVPARVQGAVVAEVAPDSPAAEAGLLPGDVIMTGTPAGVDLVQAGDRFEVEIEGIGRLSNPVVRR
jgi:serine protease Do